MIWAFLILLVALFFPVAGWLVDQYLKNGWR